MHGGLGGSWGIDGDHSQDTSHCTTQLMVLYPWNLTGIIGDWGQIAYKCVNRAEKFYAGVFGIRESIATIPRTARA